MTSYLKSFSLVLGLFLAQNILAENLSAQDKDEQYYKISKVRVEEVSEKSSSNSRFQNDTTKIDGGKIFQQNLQVIPSDGVERVGKVISTGRDLVALGEDIYRLVIKGKPSNMTSYAPLSVVPRINGAPVDILETESWSTPVKKTYQVIYENLYGIAVVTYRYSIFYSYNGSFNGSGKYLTSVQIVPEYVRTLFGFDFSATMKLGGIVNMGSKSHPIAGATIIMEYTVSSILVSQQVSDSFFVNGKGQFKKL
jgi:hypothetical protein